MAQPQRDVTKEEEGTPFGKYKLLRRVAYGGMAEIHLAKLDGPDGFSKKLVIKRILGQYAERDEFSNMFVKEAKVAALLSHPNIVQVYEFGKVEVDYYLAMELVEGMAVGKMMRMAAKKQVHLGPRISTFIGMQACEALQYAHDLRSAEGKWLGLVHRDVSPGNILVSKRGVVKLTDFGIVKLTEEPNATNVGVIKGKSGYMSPEQATAKPVDRRSDIFSLGIICYELAVERRLFKREDPVQSILAIARGEIPPPSSVVPDFPKGLENILARALQRNPADRYSTADEMGRDLEEFSASQGWGSGNRELGRLVESLLDEEARSSDKVAEVALSSTDQPTDFAGADDDLPDVSHMLEAPQPASGMPDSVWMVVIITLGVVGSILFWWFVLA